MPNRFHRWVAAHAWAILTAVTALSLLALVQLVDFKTGSLRLSIDPSLDAISTRSPEEQKLDRLTRLRFGNREAVMVMMQVDDVFKPHNLARLDQLSRTLAALPGVESVDSLTATTLPRIDGDELNYARVTPQTLKDPKLPELLSNSARDNPLISGQLVSRDGRAALILVHPAARSELEILRSHLAKRIRKTADQARSDDAKIFVSGAPLIRSAISDTVTQQLKTIIPAIILVIALLLAVVFRSLRAVLIPLIGISIGLLWILATFSLFGRPINLVSALVPPFIITMGLAYSAHVIAEHEHLLRSAARLTPVARIAEMLQEISTPVMVTGFATIAGLLALLLNEQRSMMEFAAFSALGTAYLMLLTLTLTPALLFFASPKQPETLPSDARLTRTIERISKFDQQRRPLILRVALALFVLSLLLASRIEIGDTLIGLFPENARIRIDHAAIKHSMGGVTPMDIVIEGGSADVFTDPAILRQLDSLESWLAAQPEVGSVLGLPDHVKMLNRYLAGGGNKISDSRDAIRQMLFVGDGAWLRSVVNIDRSATLIQLRLTADDTSHIGVFIDRLNNRLKQLPSGLTARLSGGAVVMTESVRKATSGQLFGVALALLLIYLCLSLQFMSLRVGLLATLPTVLQTALYFGILGLLGVSLNPTSVLVESLVLGLAIDDTIHYLSRFASAAKRSGSEKKAATMALQAVLRPVTVTKSILALGFLTMVSGELTSQELFGWLAAITLFCTWLVDIFVTPAFMSGLRIVTLWDTLRLNLGDRVQQTIPLFRALSDRQSRIFALMSNLHTLPAGTRLITEGEQSGGIYVVIDGALSVFQGKGTQKQEISRLQRGDVVGEIGYFGQRRTASVDTLTETRLLRFEDEDQERLCQAYPNIASRVFLNLNRIQAKRQAAIRKLAETGAKQALDEFERTGSFESRLN